MRHAWLLSLVLVGCAVGHAQGTSGAETRCRRDADCVLVNAMPTCAACGTCPGAWRAVSSRWLAQQTRTCAAAQRERERHAREAAAGHEPPAEAPHCPACAPPPSSASQPWTAVCRARTCTAIEGADAGAAAPSADIDSLLMGGS